MLRKLKMALKGFFRFILCMLLLLLCFVLKAFYVSLSILKVTKELMQKGERVGRALALSL